MNLAADLYCSTPRSLREIGYSRDIIEMTLNQIILCYMQNSMDCQLQVKFDAFSVLVYLY